MATRSPLSLDLRKQAAAAAGGSSSSVAVSVVPSTPTRPSPNTGSNRSRPTSASSVSLSSSTVAAVGIGIESKAESHHRSMSGHSGMVGGKITATNTPRKRDDISAAPTNYTNNPNARKGSLSTDNGESKEHKDHRRTASESTASSVAATGGPSAIPRRRGSVGGTPLRASKDGGKRERGPNFLATLDPERFICRPPKHAKKKKKAKAGEKTTSEQHVRTHLWLPGPCRSL
jgi:hypothetical protein